MSAVLLFFAYMLTIPLGLMVCTFVARDMDARGLDGRIYGALTFFLFPVGLAVWFFKHMTTPKVEPPG
jgi:uncharacterized membrane-anchored protein